MAHASVCATPTKQQHYVPQFHLRAWSNGKDPWTIGVYDKLRSKTFETGTRNVGGEKWFYHAPGEPQDFEHFMSGLEGQAAALYEKISTAERVDVLSDAEHLSLAMHICALDARTRERREMSAQVHQSLLDTIVEQMGVTDWRLKLPKGADRVLQMEAVLDAVQNPLLLDHLQLALLVNETDLPFTTSDSPILRHNDLPPRPDGGGRLGLLNAGIQLHLSISPRLCLMLYDPTTYPWVPRKVAVERASVEWARALHVQRCYAQVYGINGDPFTLEQRVVNEHPDVAERDRPRIQSNRPQAAGPPSADWSGGEPRSG